MLASETRSTVLLIRWLPSVEAAKVTPRKSAAPSVFGSSECYQRDRTRLPKGKRPEYGVLTPRSSAVPAAAAGGPPRVRAAPLPCSQGGAREDGGGPRRGAGG